MNEDSVWDEWSLFSSPPTSAELLHIQAEPRIFEVKHSLQIVKGGEGSCLSVKKNKMSKHGKGIPASSRNQF